MVKKLLVCSSLSLTLLALVVSFGMGQPKVQAQGLAPDPAAPNCYNVGGESYVRVDCNQISAFFSQKPMEPGHCYLSSGSTTAVSISVTEIDCKKVIADPSDPQETTATTTSTREEAINCDGKGDQAKLKECVEKNPLVARFTEFIDFLGIGVGVVVVTMIIIGGIQYVMAGPNPQAVSAAKKRILNAVIAFVAFLLLYSFMQWLVPGGIF